MSIPKRIFHGMRIPDSRIPLLVFLLAAGLALLGGCEFNSPETPVFDTTLTIPLGVERIEILEALDDEDYLIQDGEGAVNFFIEGDPVTMDLGFELSTDISSQTIDQGLGNFDLATLDPMDYFFELGDMWAPANGVSDLDTQVPGFPIDIVSPGQDLPDVESATLESGSVTITVTNGLPVPISADSGADQLELVMENPLDDTLLATFLFGLIEPGMTEIQSADLAGVVLPDQVQIRLAGGSPGSDGSEVTVNGDDSILVEAVFSDLVVSEAVAVVGSQDFHTTFDTELPQDYELTGAIISSGTLGLELANNMSIPCTAVLTWETLVDEGGAPMISSFELEAFATENRTVDFSGRILDADGAVLTALTAEVDVHTPGSGATAVPLTSDDGLTATLGGGALVFSSVTGLVPVQQVPVEPTEEEVDLPDELDGLELTAASMTIYVTNSAELPGTVAITLTGTSESGTTETLDIDHDIVAANAQGPGITSIQMNDEDLVQFLNNLPEIITLAGEISIGGESGTVYGNEYATVNWEIAAPLEVIINDATFETSPDSLGTDEDVRDMINDHLRGAKLEAEILNHLPVGVELLILAGTDTLTMVADPLLEIGPLTVGAALVDPVSHTVSEAVSSNPTIILTEEEARVFGQPGLYTMVVVHLPSTNGQPVKLMATDYLEIRGMVQIDVEVSDPDDDSSDTDD
ncbi:MAG: hypothetical protein KOO60_05230 [Gemmatimonadales bacterium]|nr:hypothetical protein [Gemmatimonadales bacterium]